MPSDTSAFIGEYSLAVAKSSENQGDADIEKILCIVCDQINAAVSGTISKYTLNLPVTTLSSELIDEVAKAAGYIADTITLQYDTPNGKDVDLRDWMTTTLCDLCAPVSAQRRHNFGITEIDGVEPKKVASDVGPSGMTRMLSQSERYLPSSSSDAIFKPGDYVGLVNQAMTCYLNSLLQTLFMTPEFRNAIYRLEFDGNGDAMTNSIPYNLQKLFLTLQTSTKRAVETTDLTRSFGWHSSEVWQQHDVQELCRVMFDALELNWKNTDQSSLINRLYQGKVKDYVKCLECGMESVRVDTYLDIPLVIRPFGSIRSHGSVEEALRAFVQPETLNDTNQYLCEKCNKKCDAHKGLKFLSFPYLLTLQMKRFDFDYSTMHRIKLNDRLTFPEILNLNSFVSTDDDLCPECHTVDLPVCSTPPIDYEDEGIDIDGSNLYSVRSEPSPSESQYRSITQALSTGPYVYELFSIMVHSGSAIGGHYYAYIKSFKTGVWYSFNDQTVARASLDDIHRTYGCTSYSSSTYASSMNAYMLMYRQIDPDKNTDFLEPDCFPPYLQAQLQQMKEQEERERLQQIIDRTTLKIKVFYTDPVTLVKHQNRLSIHEDCTLREATLKVYELFELHDCVPLDCCRLVRYDDYIDSLERSYDRQEDCRIGPLLGGVKQSYTFSLLLQTRQPGEQFQEYRPGGVTVTVLQVDLDNMEVFNPITVRAYQNQTVAEFKHVLSQELGLPEAMTCVLEPHPHNLKLLASPNKTLKSEGFFRNNRVFVDTKGEMVESWDTSLLNLLLQRYLHTIRIDIYLPSLDSIRTYEAEIQEKTRLIQMENAKIDLEQPDLATVTGGDLTGCDTTGYDVPLEDILRTKMGGSNLGAECASWNTTRNNMYRHDANVHNANTSPLFTGRSSPSQMSCCHTTPDAMSSSLDVSNIRQSISTELGNIGAELDNSNSGVQNDSFHMEKLSTTTMTELSDVPIEFDSFPVDTSRVVIPIYSLNMPKNDLNLSLSIDTQSLPDMPQGVSKSSLESDEGIAETETEIEMDNLHSHVYSHSDPCMYRKTCVSSPVTCPPSSICTSTDSAFTSNLNAAQVLSESLSDVNKFDMDLTGNNSYSGSEHVSPSPEADDNFANYGKHVVNSWSVDLTEDAKSEESDWERDIQENDARQNSGQRCAMADGKTGDAVELGNGLESYIRVVAYTRLDDSSLAHMVLELDRRIEMQVFKEEVQNYVQTLPCNFKVYRIDTSGQETECSRFNSTDSKIVIHLGRALTTDEYLVNIYQLRINDSDPISFLMTEIFAKDMTVLDSKRLLLPEIRRQNGSDIPLHRCRLRKKNAQNVSKIYLDHQVYPRDVPIFPNWQVFLQILDGPDPKVCSTQLVLFVKKWRPSVYEFEPFHEIVLNNNTVEELRAKMSETFDIPLEYLEFAKGRGSFPCHANPLTIEKDLDWNPQAVCLNMWPLYIIDDGAVIYYRDAREKLGELSEERRNELLLKESARLSNTISPQVGGIAALPRKEKALKIYTHDSVHSQDNRAIGSLSNHSLDEIYNLSMSISSQMTDTF